MVSDLKKEKTFWPLVALLLVTFFKECVWIGAVPIWHAPDEQAHFATIQLYAEDIVRPFKNSHSEELIISERFLGTERGSKRTNKFTFHPEYKIEYTNSQTGQYENEIKNIPISARKNMIANEAASYFPLYYQIGVLIYKSFYFTDLFIRVYAIRLFSMFTIVLTVLFAFLITRQIFPKDKLLQIAIPSLVSFHPMMSFISAGVNSDNLANLIFAIFLYLSILVIKEGMNSKLALFLGVTLGLGMITKAQFVITGPFVASLFLIDLLKKKDPIKFCQNLIIFLIFLVIFGGWFPLRKAVGNFKQAGVFLPYVETGQVENPMQNLSFLTHLKNTFYQTVAQTLPWYWGVFKWLSVVLPRIVNQILMRIMLVGAIGILIQIFLIIKRRDFSKQVQMLFFLALWAIVFFFAIVWRDWQQITTNGFSLGIQGRYFYPAIISHLTLLTLGLLVFLPSKLRKYFTVSLILGMITLNFIALYVVLNSYYSLSSLQTLLLQASQYKPVFFKYNYLIAYSLFYLLSLVFFTWQTLRLLFLTRKK